MTCWMRIFGPLGIREAEARKALLDTFGTDECDVIMLLLKDKENMKKVLDYLRAKKRKKKEEAVSYIG